VTVGALAKRPPAICRASLSACAGSGFSPTNTSRHRASGASADCSHASTSATLSFEGPSMPNAHTTNASSARRRSRRAGDRSCETGIARGMGTTPDLRATASPYRWSASLTEDAEWTMTPCARWTTDRLAG
jgi:hypothetical protein